MAMAAPFKQVVVGICAMEKKSRSKPMKEILSRLEEFEFLRPVIFPEDVILKVRGEWKGREGKKKDSIGQGEVKRREETDRDRLDDRLGFHGIRKERKRKGGSKIKSWVERIRIEDKR